MQRANFIGKINALIKSINAFRDENPSQWKSEYGLLKSELEEILLITDCSFLCAEEKFSELPIAKFDSFKAYLREYVSSVTIIAQSEEGAQKVKSTRDRKHKTYKCPSCNTNMVLEEGQFRCKSCNYTAEIKTSNTVINLSRESRKHPEKLITTIAGRGSPPRSVLKIIDYVTVWLTDLKYVHRWLIAHPVRFDVFKKKYKQYKKRDLNDAFFNTIIERKPENVWEFEIYHLLISEFQQLLEESKMLSRHRSNMWYMKREDILHIVTNFIKEKGKIVPTPDYVDDEEHELGAYFVQLLLLAQYPDTHVKNDIKKMLFDDIEEIERASGDPLTLPGLSFNFNDAFNQSESMVRRYDFQQCNSWIQRKIFNIPPSSITPGELESMLDVILAFNQYYKEYWKTEKSQTKNSPLYAVTFRLILKELPAFNKYFDEFSIFLPMKEQKTVLQIKKIWASFLEQKPEIISKYVTSIEHPVTETTPKPSEETSNDNSDDIFSYNGDIF